MNSNLVLCELDFVDFIYYFKHHDISSISWRNLTLIVIDISEDIPES